MSGLDCECSVVDGGVVVVVCGAEFAVVSP